MCSHKQKSSSFALFNQPKLQDYSSSYFQIEQFGKLTLNSHDKSDVRSLRSNSNCFTMLPLLLDQRSSDTFSQGFRSRRNSLELEWKKSQNGGTFLNKSIAGKSSLYRHDIFQNHENFNQKELSEKSCPVGTDDTSYFHSFEKISKVFQEGEVNNTHGKEKIKKKFMKTKNLLRNLSSYLHKFIKYNTKCRRFVIKYFNKKNPNSDDLQAQQFHQGFLQWISELNLSNFQEYQKIWQQDCKYKSIYRQICYKYYKQELFCDIRTSRLSSKNIILEYIPQFFQGLLSPKEFTHFQNQ